MRFAFALPLLSLSLLACGTSDAPVDMCSCGDAGPPDLGPDLGTDLGPFPTWDAGTPPTPDPYAGPSAAVEIIHDDHGVAHVYGATDTDVFYGAGYAAAVDRLFEMDLTRRQALGRRAEVLGSVHTGDDELARLINFRDYGRADAERLRMEHPTDYALVVAWTAGVNKRIDEVIAGTAPLPYGFRATELGYVPEHWVTADGFSVGKMLTFGLSDSLESDVLGAVLSRTYPSVVDTVPFPRPLYDSYTMPADERAAVHSTRAPAAAVAPPAHAAPGPTEIAAAMAHLHRLLAPLTPLGSNDWAVAGAHTDNGRPFVCGDPHQPLQSPSLTYAVHMNSADMGGAIDAAGFEFVGAPGVHFGHTARVQWAATTNFADVMDLWDVHVGGGGRTVSMGGHDLPVVLRDEAILVRTAGAPYGTNTTDDYVVREIDGVGAIVPASVLSIPVVDPGHAVVFGWMGRRPTNEFRAFLDMMRSQNVAQMEAAADEMEVGAVNLVFADASGIAYRVGAKIPDRGDPTSHDMPWRVIPGDNPLNLWNGTYLAAARLPHSHGATKGYLVTANNDPWGFTSDGDVTNDPFYYGTWYAPGERSHRIESELDRLIATGTPLSVTDMETLQTDTHSVMADELLPVLHTAWSHVATDPALATYRTRTDLSALVDLLDGWDHRMDRTSSAAVAYHGFANFLAKDVIDDDINAVFGAVMSSSPIYILKLIALTVENRYPGSDTILGGRVDDVVLAALDATASWLATKFGGTDPSLYRWDMLHGARFANDYGHDLDGGWAPSNGGDDTVSVAQSTFFDDHLDPNPRLDAVEGPIYRGVTHFDADGTPVQAVNFIRGNSGDPTSPHFADAQDDWLNGVYHEVPFRRADVDLAMESTITLPPGP